MAREIGLIRAESSSEADMAFASDISTYFCASISTSKVRYVSTLSFEAGQLINMWLKVGSTPSTPKKCEIFSLHPVALHNQRYEDIRHP